MVVYIQKKIDGRWRTLLTCDSIHSNSAFTHLCTQYCQHKFRISLDKTDDVPPEPQGLSREDTLEALCDVRLVGLTKKQAMNSFKRIVSIVCEMDKWYKH